MDLKTVTPVTSDDGKFVKLTFSGLAGESVDVVVGREEFDGMLQFLIEFSLKCKFSKALPLDPKSEDETPVSDHALLIAKNIDILRSEGGGSVLQFQTTQGAGFQLALNDKMTSFLKHAVNASLSDK